MPFGRKGKNKGGLELDSRAAMLVGGEGGPAIVPGKPKDSRLIDAISYQDEDLQMPPKKSVGKLSDSAIADFVAWVKMVRPIRATAAVAVGEEAVRHLRRQELVVVSAAQRGERAIGLRGWLGA